MPRPQTYTTPGTSHQSIKYKCEQRRSLCPMHEIIALHEFPLKLNKSEKDCHCAQSALQESPQYLQNISVKKAKSNSCVNTDIET